MTVPTCPGNESTFDLTELPSPPGKYLRNMVRDMTVKPMETMAKAINCQAKPRPINPAAAAANAATAQVIVTPPGTEFRVAGGPYTVPVSINNASRLSMMMWPHSAPWLCSPSGQ